MTALQRVWHLTREIVLAEIAIWTALGRWIVRRPAVPKNATPIGYAQLVGPILWLWIFGSAVEVVVVDVIAHRYFPDAVRLPLLVLGIWGVLWMIGLYAAYRTRPHVLNADALIARGGLRSQVTVPLDQVVSVASAQHELPGIVKTLHVEDDLLLLGVSSETNLELLLAGPTPLATSNGEVTANRVGIWVDEPRDVAALLRGKRELSRPA